jgi:hypothetical protein
MAGISREPVFTQRGLQEYLARQFDGVVNDHLTRGGKWNEDKITSSLVDELALLKEFSFTNGG